MNWKKYLKNLSGWAAIVAVCLLLYELFGLMFTIVGTSLAAFIIFDMISDRN